MSSPQSTRASGSDAVAGSEGKRPVRWPWLLGALSLGLLGLALLLAAFWQRAEPRWDDRPEGTLADVAALRQRDDLNVLFILIDTLRSDRLGSYGYARATSPQLDRLAAGGVRFARQLSQSSWTKCSMASLWSGLYPVRTGVTRFDEMLPEEAVMPAEILQQAGFDTVGLYRNGWVSPNFGFDQGFNVYSRPVPGPARAGLRQANPTIKRGGTDDDAI